LFDAGTSLLILFDERYVSMLEIAKLESEGMEKQCGSPNAMSVDKCGSRDESKQPDLI
jgi:hypothetical protein